jgi:hypothetical protein
VNAVSETLHTEICNVLFTEQLPIITHDTSATTEGVKNPKMLKEQLGKLMKDDTSIIF